MDACTQIQFEKDLHIKHNSTPLYVARLYGTSKDQNPIHFYMKIRQKVLKYANVLPGQS